MNIDNIDNNNIFLANEIKNTIINEGVFYKLNYSNHILTLTNLLIKLEIPEYTIFQNYFKYKCAFRAEKYTDFINKITALEYSILYKIYPNNKRIYRRANANISRLLQSGSFKLTQQPLEKNFHNYFKDFWNMGDRRKLWTYLQIYIFIKIEIK